MLGFGALGEYALGEGPTQLNFAVGGQFSTPIRKAGLTAAVIATTFVGFVPPPAQARPVFAKFSEPAAKPKTQVGFTNAPQPARFQPVIFSSFSQPAFSRAPIADEQSTWQFETIPALPPFTGFAKFAEPFPAKFNVSVHIGRWWGPITLPVDTHDGVFVKKKRKKQDRDPIDLELEEKAKRRAAIELAVYGPEVTYEPPAALAPQAQPGPPPDLAGLARAIMQAQAAAREAEIAALEQDDEDVIEMLLRDL